MSTRPTTYADLTAAGWFPGAGPTGYRFRSIVIGGYEITAYADGGWVSLEHLDGAIQISEADTVALATKIAALLRGETSADLTAALAERDAAREEIAQAERVLTDAGVWHPGSVVEQTGTLGADIKFARAALAEAQAENAALRARRNALHDALARMGNSLSAAGHHAGFGLDEVEQALAAVIAERDAERAELEALRARLAERPDPRDPPVSTAAEEAIERIWSALFNKASVERDDFATAASGDPAGELLDLADAVESALDKANEQIRELTDERDHAINLAMEQFRHRLYRT